MIATIVYIICLLWIPKTFKKTGIQYAIQNKLQGVLLILLSKTLWWLGLLNLSIFWFPEWQTYVTVICMIGLTYSMFKDKKYLLFDFKSMAKEKQ